MRSLSRKRSILYVVVFLSFGLFSGCNVTPLENAINSFSLVIELPKINTTTGVALQDAESMELVDQPVKVTFVGENADRVIDMYSDPITEVVVENGVLNIGLDNSIIPTNEAPVTLTMDIETDGFVTSRKQITFTQIGKLSHAVSLVSRSIPPPGVIVQETTSGLAEEGELIDSISVQIEEEGSEEDAGVSVVFPVGTVLEGTDGSAPSGTFQVSTVLYDADQQQAIAEINPDLFAPLNDSLLVMVSAVDLEIRDNMGQLITSAEPAMVAKTSSAISSSAGSTSAESSSYILNFVLNSATYTELQQLLRLAYISPTTAERYIIYSVPEVSSLPDGRVELRYALSGNVFKQAALVYFAEQPVNITLDVSRNGNEGKLPITLFDRGFSRTADLLPGNNTLALRNVTRGLKTVSVELDHTTYKQEIQVGASTYQIELPAPPSSQIDATLNVVLACVNPDEAVRLTDIPTASLHYRLSNAPSGTAWRTAQNLTWNYDAETQSLQGGSATIYGVEIGKVYDFKFFYDMSLEEGSEEVTGEQMEYRQVIDSDVCG